MREEDKPFEPCYMCGWCKNCYENAEGYPRCKSFEDADCSEAGNMANWGISKDGEADCCGFDPIPADPEPNYEPPYDDYDGYFDTIPSIFDKL